MKKRMKRRLLCCFSDSESAVCLKQYTYEHHFYTDVMFLHCIFFSQRSCCCCCRGLSLNWLHSRLAQCHWQQSHTVFNQVKPVPTCIFPIETCVGFFFFFVENVRLWGRKQTIQWNSFGLAEVRLCYAIVHRKQGEDIGPGWSEMCSPKSAAQHRVQTLCFYTGFTISETRFGNKHQLLIESLMTTHTIISYLHDHIILLWSSNW